MARTRSKLRLIQDPSRKAGKAKPKPASRLTPPPGLSREQLAEFDRLAAQYPGCSSAEMIAETARISVDLRDFERCIKKYGVLVDGGKKLNPAVRMKQTARDQLRKMLVYLEASTPPQASENHASAEVPAIG